MYNFFVILTNMLKPLPSNEFIKMLSAGRSPEVLARAWGVNSNTIYQLKSGSRPLGRSIRKRIERAEKIRIVVLFERHEIETAKEILAKRAKEA
jgi:hypothetical protein